MNQETWNEIIKAFDIVTSSSQINKLTGIGWKVYRVGMIIRIDIG